MGATLSAPPPPPPPPPDFAHTLFFVSAFYLAVLLLHVLLPGPRVEGYVCDWRGRVLTYKLNGFLLYLCTLGGFWYGGLPEELTTYAAVNWWQSVKAANVLGLGGALLLMGLTLEPPFRALTSDQKELCKRAAKGEDIMGAVTPAPQRNVAAHYFFGKAFNPRLLGIDLKMLLYALGAAALTWNLCSALALRISTHGALSNALVLYSAMLLWFVGEYMLLEVIHLYTYDLMCEKLGFKLCWGCLVFYPYFYCIGVWPLVLDAPAGADLAPPTIVAIALLFGCGWILTRGANVQKYLFKTRGALRASELMGGLNMEVVPSTRLLCSGFWGVSRHVNYLGEILQATALALPGFLLATTTYYQILPWLYPLYYVALFVPRQIDDDLQLKLKYGEKAFTAYAKRVKYRIVPGIW